MRSRTAAPAALIGVTPTVEARRALAAMEEHGRWADIAERAYTENTKRTQRAR